MNHEQELRIEEMLRLEQAAEDWGVVSIGELIRGARARGVVRRRHFRESAHAAKLAARYALQFLALLEI